MNRKPSVKPSLHTDPVWRALMAIDFIERQYHIKSLTAYDRTLEVARARQLAMWLAKQVSGLSLPDLAPLFERHHSTIQYGIESVNAAIKHAPDIQATVNFHLRTLESELVEDQTMTEDTYTRADVIEEIQREIAVRRNVYPKWIKSSTYHLTQELAHHRIALLEEALVLLGYKEEAAPEQETLL